MHQKSQVVLGKCIKKGQILAGTTVVEGELTLGKNILVAYMSWEDYNFEDVVLGFRFEFNYYKKIKILNNFNKIIV